MSISERQRKYRFGKSERTENEKNDGRARMSERQIIYGTRVIYIRSSIGVGMVCTQSLGKLGPMI